jgi:hypothetical protein
MIDDPFARRRLAAVKVFPVESLSARRVGGRRVIRAIAGAATIGLAWGFLLIRALRDALEILGANGGCGVYAARSRRSSPRSAAASLTAAR